MSQYVIFFNPGHTHDDLYVETSDIAAAAAVELALARTYDLSPNFQINTVEV